jgi:chromosome segregation ATPase
MNINKIDCKDLYDNAAKRLKGLDNDIDKTIQDLAKNLEARGVPKNRVARHVVKELTAREVLSPSRIYEGLGIEQKRKYKKREIEETFPQVKNISTEESSINQQTIQVAATRIGRSETLKDANEVPGIEVVSEEQKRFKALRQENEDLRNKERLKEKEKLELIKKIAYLEKENARLRLEKEELEEQLAEKKQISELRKDDEGLQKNGQLEIKESYHKPGLPKAKKSERVSELSERYEKIFFAALSSEMRQN